jgi:DNA-binding NarL/FixJ family response regulator
MPELMGIELARLTFELNPNLKYIFITGHITQSYSETLHEIPHSRLIRKPIDFELLHEAVNEHLKDDKHIK